MWIKRMIIYWKRKKSLKRNLKKKILIYTGFPGHDEAFCRINGEKYSFLAKGGLQITKE